MGIDFRGRWTKQASYGFDPDGIIRIEEYCPNALESTYKGVFGYIYSARISLTAALKPIFPTRRLPIYP